MIKVFFDLKPLAQGHAIRGIGYYIKNLLEELQKNKEIKLVSDVQEADVVHFPYFDLFFNTLKSVPGKKNVVTVFDVIPLLYPKHYPSGIKGKINLLRQKNALSKVDAVITISETSKKDIVRFLGVAPDKVFPIHLAPQKEFKKLESGDLQLTTKKRYSLPDRFVLYVGDVNYNKNLLTLAESCLKANISLVIVGKQAVDESVDLNHTENRSFSDFLSKYGDNKKIIRLGFVETKDLVAIYNLATVYCHPSYYEGFGLPILEALACGTPVVASRIQAHVEIAEGSCLFEKEFTNSDKFAETLKQFLGSQAKRETLTESGLENVKNYSWKKTVEETIKVLR